MKFSPLDSSDCCPPISVSGNGINAVFSPYFEPDWHPFYAERLAVFPRSVVVHDSQQRTSWSCWPDLATLTEDAGERQMAYYPAEPSSRSLLLIFDKPSEVLHLRIYEDDRILLRTLVSDAINNKSQAAESL
ncbi:MAG: hypothetical protein L0Z53_02300 [Acidobacteriales bacterium]|nr:hypothetical protein [Terriglobales bacterium]